MFDALKERKRIVEWIREWFAKNGEGCNAVLGISGGKDSTVAAALCAEALGKHRVIGIMLPDGMQHDIKDSKAVIAALGITGFEINIGNATYDIMSAVAYTVKKDNKAFELSPQTMQNLPPRIRMATLYAVSQSMNGRVVNTCNLSETMIGWETRWGDAVGDFAPLAQYTASEVVEIGLTYEELPKNLVKKPPSDGLCGKTDEDAFGFSYRSLDAYLRNGTSGNEKDDEKIAAKIRNSEFKRKPISFCPYEV